MKEYKVLFYYYGDLRCERIVRSMNCVGALSAACDNGGLWSWMDGGKGFRIEIVQT